MCDFINAHEVVIQITSLGEFRGVMRKVLRVIKEAHLGETKRRQASRWKKANDTRTRTQKDKSLIFVVKRGGMRNEVIERRLDEIFGKGIGDEIRTATTMVKIAERIEEMSKGRSNLICGNRCG